MWACFSRLNLFTPPAPLQLLPLGLPLIPQNQDGSAPIYASKSESKNQRVTSRRLRPLYIQSMAEARYHTVCKVGCVEHGCVEIVSDAIGRWLELT